MSISPEFIVQRRGFEATLIWGPATKIAPIGRRSFQFTWKGYFFAYRCRTSPERSWARAPAGPKRNEKLNVLVTPGFMSRQVITSGYLVFAESIEDSRLTEHSTSSL